MTEQLVAAARMHGSFSTIVVLSGRLKRHLPVLRPHLHQKRTLRRRGRIDAKSRGCHLIACRSARSFLAMGHRLPGAVSSSRSTLSRRMVGLRGRTFLCVKRTHRPSRADGATASAEWFSPRPGRDVSARRKADAERLGIRPWLQVRAGMIGRISAWHA